MPRQRKTIGDYRILEELSGGSFCTVFHCLDARLQREVAVKTVRANGRRDPKLARERLQREAVVRTQIEHPHVLPLYAMVGAKNAPALVGPWMAGGSLGRILGPAWDAQAVIELAAQVGSGLDAIHRAGWIHGDLNSGAILFSRDARAVIADFGSARRAGEPGKSPAGGHALELTPQTAAPEIWRGEPATPASDLYALSALLYRLMIGNFPFEGADWTVAAKLHCEADVATSAAGFHLLGNNVARVFSRGLSKSPGDRFESGAELAEELRLAVVSALDSPSANSAALAAVADNLDAFALTLTEEERVSLSALLKSVEVSASKSVAEAEALTAEVFGPGAALLALEACGAAAAMANGPISARTLAARCGVDERRVRRLLDALSAVGLAGQKDGHYSLPECLAVIYGNAQQRGSSARPVSEATAFWSHLAAWAKTGEPYVRMEDAGGSLYSRAVSTLGNINRELAQRLADELRSAGEIPRAARILDVGAGSAVWSIALAAADSAATVTALDRESVLPFAQKFADEAGVARQMKTIAGDWRDAPLDSNGYDVILLANVCHLEPAEQVAAMLKRFHGALRRNGILVVIDTIPETSGAAPPSVLLHSLRLGLRATHGELHDLQQYRKCIRMAGLRDVRTIALVDGDANVRAIVARKRRTTSASGALSRRSP